MANYCETIYAVEGEIGILCNIRDVINNVAKHHNDNNLTTFNLRDIATGISAGECQRLAESSCREF